MDGRISPRCKKRKIEEEVVKLEAIKLDDETIKRLVTISHEQKFQLKRLQNEVRKAEINNRQLVDYIQTRCNHYMVREIEPCSPTHYECTKCGYWY